jgi:cellulose synthase/poly-beta-1,6-N-acetylglucosamine synthase-like glycosyltransferase
MVFFLLFVKYYTKMYVKKKTKWRPKISVIVPAYNEEKNIRKCIESLLSANYPKDKLEVIVVDDGSTDRTYEIAKSIKDKRVKVYTKPNSGKGASLNFGIERASGELIAVLDADSTIGHETILRMLHLFEDEDVAAVTAAVKVRKSSNLIKEFQRIEYLFIIFTRKLLSFIDAVPVTPGPFSIYRSNVLRKIGGFDENNLVEDHEIALRLQYYNYKIRSSIDADVYTEVPENTSALMKQRVRWQKGGILNVINYRKMINPAYGDFGVFVLPLTILSVFLVFGITAITIYSFFSHSKYADLLGLEAMFIGVSPFTVVAILLFILSLIWAYGVVRSFKNEVVNVPLVVAYLMFYWFFSLAYNSLMIIKEIKKEKITW